VRRVNRTPLSPATARYLQKKQQLIDLAGREVTKTWDAARKTLPLKEILRTLQEMMGTGARCMYCVHSHGADIDHFWPKAAYPPRAFAWANLLLCCTECGRFKGDRFPLDHGRPLLVDPTGVDPWAVLDFDPQTGNLAARFDRRSDGYFRKGTTTVELLQLDRREALSYEYKKTWRRISRVVARYLSGEEPGAELIDRLLDADDHGLLGWCFDGTGVNESPFREWRERDPITWHACAARVRTL